MTKTIRELRQAGYKVRVMHERPYDKNKVPLSRGGKTTIEITDPYDQNTGFGISYCSQQDNFNRRLGNKIALGRAIEMLAVARAGFEV